VIKNSIQQQTTSQCNKHESPAHHHSNTEQTPHSIHPTNAKLATSCCPHPKPPHNAQPVSTTFQHTENHNEQHIPTKSDATSTTDAAKPSLPPLQSTYRNNCTIQTLPLPPLHTRATEHTTEQNAKQHCPDGQSMFFAQMISTAITTSLQEGSCPAQNQPTTLDEAIPECNIRMMEQTKMKLQVLSGLIEGDGLTPFWQDFTSESTKATQYQVLYQYLEEVKSKIQESNSL